MPLRRLRLASGGVEEEGEPRAGRSGLVPPAQSCDPSPTMGEETTPDEAPARRRYLSPLMEERRHRILQSARALIAEGGDANLTINRLSQRAQASPKAIYLAFGDRDGVIAAALTEHMETIEAFLEVAPPAQDTLSILREFDWIIAELFRGPEFARVIIDYYFSANPRGDAIVSLRSVPLLRMQRWLAQARRQGQLVEGLDFNRLAYSYIDGEYAVLQRWASGRIADANMADEMKANFLEKVIVMTREPYRDALDTLLAGVHARLPGREGAN